MSFTIASSRGRRKVAIGPCDRAPPQVASGRHWPALRPSAWRSRRPQTFSTVGRARSPLAS